MKDKIEDICHELEKEYNIEVLFAVESGSRLWRIDSKDSDYDVRFVFKRPVADYLRLHNLRDVIERKFEPDIDVVGFDIYKFFRLLLNSNPSIIEWLNSDIIYFDDGITKEFLRDFIEGNFNPIALFHHYRSMCKNNYLTYLKTCKALTYKKYLYAMRGLINAKYVVSKMAIPPIKFVETVHEITLPEDVRDKVLEIIEIKKEGCEGEYISKLYLFEKYIEEFLEMQYELPTNKMQNAGALQDFLYKKLGID